MRKNRTYEHPKSEDALSVFCSSSFVFALCTMLVFFPESSVYVCVCTISVTTTDTDDFFSLFPFPCFCTHYSLKLDSLVNGNSMVSNSLWMSSSELVGN